MRKAALEWALRWARGRAMGWAESQRGGSRGGQKRVRLEQASAFGVQAAGRASEHGRRRTDPQTAPWLGRAFPSWLPLPLPLDAGGRHRARAPPSTNNT